jgi:hypothetical protein
LNTESEFEYTKISRKIEYLYAIYHMSQIWILINQIRLNINEY